MTTRRSFFVRAGALLAAVVLPKPPVEEYIEFLRPTTVLLRREQVETLVQVSRSLLVSSGSYTNIEAMIKAHHAEIMAQHLDKLFIQQFYDGTHHT